MGAKKVTGDAKFVARSTGMDQKRFFKVREFSSMGGWRAFCFIGCVVVNAPFV
jgi:hypothetical protein